MTAPNLWRTDLHTRPDRAGSSNLQAFQASEGPLLKCSRDDSVFSPSDSLECVSGAVWDRSGRCRGRPIICQLMSAQFPDLDGGPGGREAYAT